MTTSSRLVADALEDPEIAHAVSAERTRMLFAHTLSVGVTNLAFGIALACVVWAQMQARNPMVWTWLAIKVASVLPWLVHLALYRRSKAQDDPGWRRRHIVLVAIDGAVWGLAGWWLMPHDDLVVTAIIAASLAGAAAVGVLVFQVDMVCNLAYALPLYLPAGARLAMRGDAWGLFGAFGFLLLVTIMLLEARRTERSIIELVCLRLTTDRIAQEREQALADARHHAVVKDQFLANMSHELRTPLHGILGLTKLVAQREQDEESRRQLALVERSGRHLLTVVNDVLDFSKLEAGQLKVQAQPFDLTRLLEDVAALSTVNAQAKGLELRTRLDLPRPCWVEGDAARLQQILHNLLGNAIKFTDLGHVELHARREEHHGEPGTLVALTIEDTGVGIAPAELPRIFDAFHQADRSWDRRFGGTGLGLTISRRLARAMGGDIVCMSTPGRGSRFTVTVPLPATQAAPETAMPAGMGPAQATNFACRVLLAEDNPVNALVAQAALEQLGLDVTHVTDGQAAVDWLQVYHADIVLMDCQMPVMDGFEATRRIREWEAQHGGPGRQAAPGNVGVRRHMPVIALTANAMDSDRERCLQAGMDDHLAKPFSEAELRAVLARHLGDAGGVTPSVNGAVAANAGAETHAAASEAAATIEPTPVVPA